MQGVGSRVEGAGSRGYVDAAGGASSLGLIPDSGFGVQGSGFRVQGSGCRVQGSGFGVPA